MIIVDMIACNLSRGSSNFKFMPILSEERERKERDSEKPHPVYERSLCLKAEKQIDIREERRFCESAACACMKALFCISEMREFS